MYGDELGVVFVVLALGGAASRFSVDEIWSIWSGNAELGLFRSYSRAGRSHSNLQQLCLSWQKSDADSQQASGKQSCWWQGFK